MPFVWILVMSSAQGQGDSESEMRGSLCMLRNVNYGYNRPASILAGRL